MIRHAAAVALVVCLSPSWLFAQGTTITVSTATASVYRSPSTGSPTVGTVRRGTVLDVTRELGSWVKIAWPVSPDGVGYLHVSMGTLARGSAVMTNRPGEAPSARAAGSSSSAAPVATLAQGVRAEQNAAARRASPPRSVYVTPATHFVGIGGRMGGTTFGGFGASARAWRQNRLGVQLQISRHALNDGLTPGRLTSMHIEPSALYSLPDRVTDHFWLRPYVGSGISLRRQTLKSAVSEAVSDTGLGLQTFGGGEVTFAAIPHFAISADVDYHWFRNGIAGFEDGGLGLSLAGHWYVK